MRASAERVSGKTWVGSSTSGCAAPVSWTMRSVRWTLNDQWIALRDDRARDPPRRTATPDAGGRAHGVGLDDWRAADTVGRRTGRRIVTTRASRQRGARSASRHVGLGLAKQHSRTARSSHFRAARRRTTGRISTRADRAHTTVALSPAGWYSQSAGHAARRSRARRTTCRRSICTTAGIGFSTRNPRDRGRREAAHPDAVAGVGARREPYGAVGCRGRRWAGRRRELSGRSVQSRLFQGLGFESVRSRCWDRQIKASAYARWPCRATRCCCRSSGRRRRRRARRHGVVQDGVDADSDVHDRTCEVDRRRTCRRAVANESQEHTRGYFRADASIGMVRAIVGPATQVHMRVLRRRRAQRASAAVDLRVVAGSVRDVQQRSVPRARRAVQAERRQLSAARRRGAARFHVQPGAGRRGAVNGEFVQRLVDGQRLVGARGSFR